MEVNHLASKNFIFFSELACGETETDKKFGQT